MLFLFASLETETVTWARSRPAILVLSNLPATSWETLKRDLQLNDTTVDECLAHSSKTKGWTAGRLYSGLTQDGFDAT